MIIYTYISLSIFIRPVIPYFFVMIKMINLLDFKKLQGITCTCKFLGFFQLKISFCCYTKVPDKYSYGYSLFEVHLLNYYLQSLSDIYYQFCYAFFSTVNVSLPKKVRNNGTMYVHVFLVPPGQDPFASQYTVHRFSPITTYTLPKSEVFSLMGDTQKVGVICKD